MIPFETSLKTPDQRTAMLHCHGLLRTIPGRRTVFDATQDGRPVIVKRFEDAWGGYRCRREMRGLERLRQRGLPAPRALLRGTDPDGHHALVLEKIAGAVNALTAVQSADSEALLRPTLLAVVRYVARLHEAGVLQHDLHLGNFLLAESAVFAIDPARMRFESRPIGESASHRQLGILWASLPQASLPWQADLLIAYCELRGWPQGTERLAEVRRFAASHRRKRLPHDLAKTLRNSRLFAVLRTPDCLVVYGKETLTADAARHLAEQVKTSHTSGTAEHPVAGTGERYSVTSYPPTRGLRVLIASPARRAWLAAWRARYTGGTADCPAALIEQREGVFTRRSWLVTVRPPHPSRP